MAEKSTEVTGLTLYTQTEVHRPAGFKLMSVHPAVCTLTVKIYCRGLSYKKSMGGL